MVILEHVHFIMVGKPRLKCPFYQGRKTTIEMSSISIQTFYPDREAAVKSDSYEIVTS